MHPKEGQKSKVDFEGDYVRGLRGDRPDRSARGRKTLRKRN
jgi:hypothetical protein